jgi:predicted metal-binding membrane protein
LAAEGSVSAPDLPRRVTVPVAVLVAVLVAVAWYVTFSTSTFAMSFLMTGAPTQPLELALFFGLTTTMMVAMMLPAALPMIVAFHGMTRLEGGRPVKPADTVATAMFVAPYFLVWGAFGVLALVALVALGLMGPMTGALAIAPAATLVVAGVYQLTRPKEVCLANCQSPMAFVMRHWRSGRTAAARMGLHHAAYCLGCCWLFMLVLFIAGSMSLVWMAALSIVIFAEKATRRIAVVRGVGALLIVLGAVIAVQSYLMM